MLIIIFRTVFRFQLGILHYGRSLRCTTSDSVILSQNICNANYGQLLKRFIPILLMYEVSGPQERGLFGCQISHDLDLVDFDYLLADFSMVGFLLFPRKHSTRANDVSEIFHVLLYSLCLSEST